MLRTIWTLNHDHHIPTHGRLSPLTMPISRSLGQVEQPRRPRPRRARLPTHQDKPILGIRHARDGEWMIFRPS
jgi:hypothetical protein